MSHAYRILDRFGHKLGAKTLDEWYTFDIRSINDVGAEFLLHRYNNSVLAMVSNVYTHYKWDSSKFKTVPRRHWHSIQNQHNKLSDIAETLNVHLLSDWYNISYRDIVRHGGHFISKYNGSVYNMLSHMFPNHEWDMESFKVVNQVAVTVSTDSSTAIEIQDFFNAMGEQRGITHLDTWHSVRVEDIIKSGGLRLLQKYSRSIRKLLALAYPKFKWHEWRFSVSKDKDTKTVPTSYWNDLNNQRAHMDDISEKLGIKHLGQWVNIKRHEIEPYGVGTLINKHGASMPKMLRAVYSDYNWQFKDASYWSNTDNQKTFLSYAADKLRVRTPKQWYRVSDIDLLSLGQGTACLKFYPTALMLLYPKHEWNWHRFSSIGKKSKQRRLLSCTELFNL